MKSFLAYLRNGFGLRKSHELAFNESIEDRLITVFLDVFKLIAIGAAIGYAVTFIDKQVETRVVAHQGYVKELEKVVAHCLDGKSVAVGGQLYLCGLYNVGEKL